MTKTQIAEVKGKRIELSPSCDLWMRGARFGNVTDVRKLGYLVKLDRYPGSIVVPFSLLTFL